MPPRHDRQNTNHLNDDDQQPQAKRARPNQQHQQPKASPATHSTNRAAERGAAKSSSIAGNNHHHHQSKSNASRSNNNNNNSHQRHQEAWHQGTLISWIPDKRFGFIRADDPSQFAQGRDLKTGKPKTDIFCSLNVVQNGDQNILQNVSEHNGIRVDFSAHLKQNGGYEASAVVLHLSGSSSSSSSKMQSGGMATGRFVRWDQEKAYGFIRTETGEEFYCHTRQITNLTQDALSQLRDLKKNLVQANFTIKQSKKDKKPEACNVAITERSLADQVNETLPSSELRALAVRIKNIARMDAEDLVAVLGDNASAERVAIEKAISFLNHHATDLEPYLRTLFTSDLFWPPARSDSRIDIPEAVDQILYDLFKKFMVNASTYYQSCIDQHFIHRQQLSGASSIGSMFTSFFSSPQQTATHQRKVTELGQSILLLISSYAQRFHADGTSFLFPQAIWKLILAATLNNDEAKLYLDIKDTATLSQEWPYIRHFSRFTAIEDCLVNIAKLVGKNQDASRQQENDAKKKQQREKQQDLGVLDTDPNRETTIGSAPVDVEIEDFVGDNNPSLLALLERPHSFKHHLDSLFHLTREDAVRPLRTTVLALRNNPNMTPDARRKLRIKAYHECRIVGLNIRGAYGSTFAIKFKPPTNARWALSKRLMPGSLVLLSPDNFKDAQKIIVGIVDTRDRDELKNGNIELKFPLEDRIDLMKVFSSAITYEMIESSVYWEASVHVLKALKRIAHGVDHPLPDVIRRCIEASRRFANQMPPASSQIPTWQSLPRTYREHYTLDATQERAMIHILSSSVAVVQGVPGSGKSYTGVVAARILLDHWNNQIPEEGFPPIVIPRRPVHDNDDDQSSASSESDGDSGDGNDEEDRIQRQHNEEQHARFLQRARRRAEEERLQLLNPPKILVVCYTNHALDDYLGDLLEKRPQLHDDNQLLRLGGGSKNPDLEKFSLRNHINRGKVYGPKKDAQKIFETALAEFQATRTRVDTETCPNDQLRQGFTAIQRAAKDLEKKPFNRCMYAVIIFLNNLHNAVTHFLEKHPNGQAIAQGFSPHTKTKFDNFVFKMKDEDTKNEAYKIIGDLAEQNHSSDFSTRLWDHIAQRDNLQAVHMFMMNFKEAEEYIFPEKVCHEIENAFSELMYAKSNTENPLDAWAAGKICPHESFKQEEEQQQKHPKQNNNKKVKEGKNNNNNSNNNEDEDDLVDLNLDQWADGNEFNRRENKGAAFRFDQEGFVDVEDSIYESKTAIDEREQALGQQKMRTKETKAQFDSFYLRYRGIALPQYPRQARQEFAKLIRRQQIIRCVPKLRLARSAYNDQIKLAENRLWDEESRVLNQQAHVIGATTTGLAKNLRMIAKVKNIRTILVEEAAEISEAQLLAALPPHCSHVIMIGDHQQLRPKVNEYELATKYKLDISFMERLVRTGTVNFVTLDTQRRMRTEISQFIRPFYEKTVQLLDHDCVENEDRCPDDIVGMNGHVHFISHNERENRDDETNSVKNDVEARFVAFLARHIWYQDRYKPVNKNIIIITPYVAQVLAINRYVKEFCGQSLAREQLPRCVSIDDFQGEEADVTILSLTRSDKLGFLAIENRIIVALSRARLGMFVVGNFGVFEKAEESTGWPGILATAAAQNRISDHVELKCTAHETITKVYVADAKNLDKLKTAIAPNGGCGVKCGLQRKCGHTCETQCHGGDCSTKAPCKKPCQEPARGCRFSDDPAKQHRCTKKCSDKTCSLCTKRVEKMFPCGHSIEVPCHVDEHDPLSQCEAKVEKTHPRCKLHKLKLECHQWTAFENGNLSIDDLPPCKKHCGLKNEECDHKCTRECHECFVYQVEATAAANGEVFDPRVHVRPGTKIIHKSCQHPCGRTLTTCAHICTAPCSDICPPCGEKCDTECDHAKCRNKSCGEPCISCSEPCLNKCPHTKCTKNCGDVCDRDRCNERCPKKLKCGHQCYGLCGEKCPPVCLECKEFGENDKYVDTRDLFIDTIDGTENPLLLLPCGCVVDRENMDGFVDHRMSLFTEKGELLPVKCMKCNAPLPIKGARRYKKEIMEIHTFRQLAKKQMIDEDAARIKACKETASHLQELYDEYKQYDIRSQDSPVICKLFASVIQREQKYFTNNLVPRPKNKKTKQQEFRPNPRSQAEFTKRVKALLVFGHLLIRPLSVASSSLTVNVRRSLLESTDNTHYTGDPAPESNLSALLRKLANEKQICEKEDPHYRMRNLYNVLFCALYRMLHFLKSADGVPEEGQHLIPVARNSLLALNLAVDQGQIKPFTDDALVKEVFQGEDVTGVLKDLFEKLFTAEDDSEKMLGDVFKALQEKDGSIKKTSLYRCPNGHPYFIGECGGAVMEAICPCGAKIGGTGHRLRADNKGDPENDWVRNEQGRL